MKVPERLGSTSFSIERFLTSPSPNRNAAPLYLDAFFEFGDEMAQCYPDESDHDCRRQATLDRSKLAGRAPGYTGLVYSYSSFR